MNGVFYSGEDPERGKAQQGQPDPQGKYVFLNIYSLYRLFLNDYMHMLHKHTGGLEVFLIQYIKK